MPPTLAVQTHGLTKRYRTGVLAVNDLNLEIRSGEVYGFLGPNGAGKTTTLRMLSGLLLPTAGLAIVAGASPGSSISLSRLGAMVETPAFYRLYRHRVPQHGRGDRRRPGVPVRDRKHSRTVAGQHDRREGSPEVPAGHQAEGLNYAFPLTFHSPNGAGPPLVDATRGTITLVVYLVVFVLASALLFRRRDSAPDPA